MRSNFPEPSDQPNQYAKTGIAFCLPQCAVAFRIFRLKAFESPYLARASETDSSYFRKFMPLTSSSFPQKAKVYDTHITELLHYLILHKGGMGQLTTQIKHLFDYTIKGLQQEQGYAEKAAWSVFGRPLEDMMSLMKLQALMIDESTEVAKFIVPFHHKSAVAVLTQLKPIKNPKLQEQLTKLLAAWADLKNMCDSAFAKQPQAEPKQKSASKSRSPSNPARLKSAVTSHIVNKLAQKREEAKKAKKPIE